VYVDVEISVGIAFDLDFLRNPASLNRFGKNISTTEIDTINFSPRGMILTATCTHREFSNKAKQNGIAGLQKEPIIRHCV
jgi:hypothetical protein